MCGGELPRQLLYNIFFGAPLWHSLASLGPISIFLSLMWKTKIDIK